jgi:hypothetical protein
LFVRGRTSCLLLGLIGEIWIRHIAEEIFGEGYASTEHESKIRLYSERISIAITHRLLPIK